MGYLITLVIIIAVPVVLVQYSTGMSAGYSAAAAVGIVVALISLSILRSKLKRAARRKSLIGKYGSEDLVEMIMDQKIWKGMTSDQLLDTLGKPESVDQEISARRVREVWKYDRIGENRYRNRVTVDNGQVSAWTAKGL